MDYAWKVIPNQFPGCQDDWVELVRIYQAEDGCREVESWQRLVGDVWEEFEGPPSGYGLQIG